jgi:hypothetical protein
MNFGYTPESFGLLILLGFGALIVLVILFQLARLIARLFGAKSDSLALGLCEQKSIPGLSCAPSSPRAFCTLRRTCTNTLAKRRV